MRLISFFLFLSVHCSIYAQEYGLASYYADKYQGNSTASGEKYDKSEFIGAHNSLPFGTLVKVTRLDNNKSVVVKIIDRGPFTKGRVIDISRAAAEAIDLIVAGESRVRLDVVGQGNSSIPATAKNDLTPKGIVKEEIKAPKQNSNTTATPSTYADNSIPKSQRTDAAKPVVAKKEETTKKATTTPKSNPTKTTVASKTTASTGTSSNIGKPKVVRGDFQNTGLYKIQLLRPEKKGFGVQIASYTNYENALQKVSELQGKWFDDILLNIVSSKNGDTYQIILGQFPTEASASNYQKSLKSKYKINGFVVNLTTL